MTDCEVSWAKATFTENAAAYIEKLSALDETYQAALKDATQRTFVTQHAAFGYLARQYDLVEESISGISPDQEPTPSRLAELKEYVEEKQVKVIYFEENASSKVAETLASETGVELAVLNPLESLTQEQMDNGETYLSVMEDNLAALQKYSLRRRLRALYRCKIWPFIMMMSPSWKTFPTLSKTANSWFWLAKMGRQNLLWSKQPLVCWNLLKE